MARGTTPLNSAVPPESKKTIARSLGQFVGHIIHGVRTPVGGAAASETVELRRETQTEQRDTPMGMVKVRRTLIEEAEVPRASSVGVDDATGNGSAPGVRG